LYNYADDNTLSYVNDNYEKLIDILEKESSVLIDPYADSLQRRMSCGRQSKAFERSIRIAATY
jgi:hypothetical protein